MVDFIEEKTKLITALDQGFSGVDFSAAYTALLDSYLKDLYREALNGKEAPKGLALVALGGFYILCGIKNSMWAMPAARLTSVRAWVDLTSQRWFP
ncbi:MAG: hypothetical protein JRF41_00225 [Deltaproteobacteria bacterium]|nr:hypothetical protein [Deltaproteobacteria bacterium]